MGGAKLKKKNEKNEKKKKITKWTSAQKLLKFTGLSSQSFLYTLQIFGHKILRKLREGVV